MNDNKDIVIEEKNMVTEEKGEPVWELVWTVLGPCLIVAALMIMDYVKTHIPGDSGLCIIMIIAIITLLVIMSPALVVVNKLNKR